MGNRIQGIQQRRFAVKAGMTVEDIKKSKNASVLMKKYASAFDTDGKKGFSQREADLLNATTFSEKADGSVTFWTRLKNGTKKGTKFKRRTNISFKTNEEVKPYVKTIKKKSQTSKKVNEQKTDDTIIKIFGFTFIISLAADYVEEEEDKKRINDSRSSSNNKPQSEYEYHSEYEYKPEYECPPEYERSSEYKNAPEG